MVVFNAIIEKFANKGEKTGWTYIVIDAEKAQQLNAGVKKEYKVKGTLDSVAIEQTSVMPMGNGDFILPLNADKRKFLKKRKGDTIAVKIQVDNTPYTMDEDFMACLQDDTAAYTFFKMLTASHQRYFDKWIASAKTEVTKAKRIAQALEALAQRHSYSEMIRANKGH